MGLALPDKISDSMNQHSNEHPVYFSVRGNKNAVYINETRCNNYYKT